MTATRTHLRDTDSSARRMEPMPPADPSSHFTPAAHRNHVRDTDAAKRNLAMARAQECRAGIRAWQEQTARDELAESITALVDKIHAPLDRIADDHRRFRERYNIGSASK